MKKIFVDGRLGKDAEVGVTKSGTKYLRFNLACDTYTNGQKETEWWDVTTYDPFLVEKKAEILKKGRYVIVEGSFTSRVNTNNGKVYLNQYLNASSIEIPSLGTRNDDEHRNVVGESTQTYVAQPAPAAQPVPTYTAQPAAMPQVQMPAPQSVQAPTPAYAAQPAPMPAYAAPAATADDDLPF